MEAYEAQNKDEQQVNSELLVQLCFLVVIDFRCLSLDLWMSYCLSAL